MKKQELLEFLREAIRTEEGATVVYLKHLDAFCTRFDINKEYIDKIKESVKILIDGNKKHKEICEDTYKKILEDKRNDY